MGLRDRYGILASTFDSRFIGNRFKLERNIRLGCGAVPHQGGLNLSAILFIEHNRLLMPFQLCVHRHHDHFPRFISYDEITVRRDFNNDCIRKILHMAVYQRISSSVAPVRSFLTISINPIILSLSKNIKLITLHNCHFTIYDNTGRTVCKFTDLVAKNNARSLIR